MTKKPAYTNLQVMLQSCCDKYPENIAYSNMGTNMTYAEFLGHAQSVSHFLTNELKLVATDRVAIMLPNCLQQPIAVFGTLISGLCVVNVNPLYTPDELSHQLKNSEAKAIIVLENMAHVVEKSLSGTKIEHVIISKLGDMHPSIKKHVLNFAIKYLKHMVPAYHLPNALDFNDMLLAPRQTNLPDIAEDSLAFIQYTGGTTGRSKGAKLTHANLCWNITQAIDIVPADLYQEKTTILTALPLYHIFSLTVSMVTLTYGGKNLLITNPRDLPALISTLKKEPVHGIPILNTLMHHLMQHPKFNEIDFSALRATIAGGMSTQTEVANRWQKLTGCVVNEGYGLSETSPIISLSDNHKIFSGNVGMPAPHTEVRTIDKEGNVCDYDVPGELQVKGPQVMAGYWKIDRDDDDHPFTDDGWFHTGDIATISSQGQIKILDRLKDMIIISGFNVYPSEVEDVIVKHPDVSECGVCAFIDETGNENVKAFIVRHNPKITALAIQDYCHEHLTHYKVPKYVEFTDELPKSPIGKILRRKLKAP